MSVVDPISDLLNRIRNAVMVNHQSTTVPFSTIKLEIIKTIKTGGYIKGYKVTDKDGKKDIRIYLKYDSQNKPIINGLKRVSSPGRRVYVKKDKIPKVLGGLGIAILSTSNGVMTDSACKQANTGGELLCYVW
ncbi:MAG: 30S ribosomal protein S8 [bacterium]